MIFKHYKKLLLKYKILFIFIIILVYILPSKKEIIAYPITKTQFIIQTAKHQIGVRYRHGGNRPEIGFDCSGFVSWVLAQNGIDLGRSSPDIMRHGISISRNNLQPGDLVFFTSNLKHKRATHVGIYLGENEFIHAASNHRCIQVSYLSEEYWIRHYFGARRI